MPDQHLEFPQGFLWGASTSSHQVEGNNKNDWTEWEKSKKRVKHLHKKGHISKYGLDNFISHTAANHYHLYKEDYQLAKEMGHNAARFSLEWSRIEPEEGKFNQEAIQKYREMIKHMKEQGIEPLATLWHWTIPLWFRDLGGWESNKSVFYFARYVEKIASELKDEVNIWITLNEPEIFTVNSYFVGVWPPQKKNPISYLRVLHNLIKAHQKSFRVIKNTQSSAQVGIAKNNIHFEPHKPHFVNHTIKKIYDWWWNFYFLNHIKDHQDFIGLNYYFHNKINWGMIKNENKLISDLGWELHPEGIYHVLKDLKKYNKPVYITENGLADADDKQRAWFIVQILRHVHQAIKDGVDVKGYMHWSLLDNFEWDKGFYPRFGLVEVDYKTQKRTPRGSSGVYAEISKNNAIHGELLSKHGKI